MSMPLRSASPIRTPSVAAAEIGPSTPIVTPQTSPTTPGRAAGTRPAPPVRPPRPADRTGRRRPGYPAAMSVIDWLLDGDPAIRWQVLRDLGNASPDDVAAEQARVEHDGWGGGLPALEGPDGSREGGG